MGYERSLMADFNEAGGRKALREISASIGENAMVRRDTLLIWRPDWQVL